MGSEIADALVVGMSTFTNTFTEQMKESAKSQQVLSENHMLDKPVHGIIELQPEMGYKLTVNAFLTWLKSVEEAWGKVSACVTQVIAKLRSNLRVDENDLRKMISDKMNERLFTSLSDKVGGTLKKTVWPSQKLDGIGYLFAVLRVAVAPDQRDWSKRLATFYDLPEIVPVKHLQLENAFQAWLMVATEVIYSTQFTAESAKENLRQFLKYYPDLVACVDSIWQGSNKDYEVLEQIFVQLKREVAEATTRLSRATKHRWGNEHATAEQEAAASKNRSNNSGRGRARRGSSSDAEKEPKKEGSRQRSASEPDINAAKKQGKGKGKGRSRKLCWDYVETGTCEYGNDCRFVHEMPQEEPEEKGQGGRGSNSTQPSPSQHDSKGGTVRYAKQDDDQQEAETAYEDADTLAMVRMLCKEVAELKGRWLILRSSCSNPNPNNNPDQPGGVVRVLRTMAHSRGYTKPVGPAVDPKNTLDKPGGIPTEKGGHDELGWKVVCRKPKSKKGKQQVVHGTYHAPK
jgi:hypothetical protein